jgi:hypothetical protein
MFMIATNSYGIDAEIIGNGARNAYAQWNFINTKGAALLFLYFRLSV